MTRKVDCGFWILLWLVNIWSVSCTSRTLVLGVDGGTESIRAALFDATTGKPIGKACAVPYHTHHPQPGYAEQDPHEWYQCLVKAVRGTLEEANEEVTSIRAMCIDTTCCSVVAMDQQYEPVRPCLLWMDQRAAAQCHEILTKCRGDPALNINCGGQGPISAEWMLPKCMWLKQHSTHEEWYERIQYIGEYQDYLNYRLTGVFCASSCNAATRWHWDGQACLQPGQGRPTSLYEKLGIPELANKLPQTCLTMGDVVGTLTESAARDLGLSTETVVIQGGADAFVGMLGLGCIHPGQMCLITGSSHLHCVISDQRTTAPGTWGAYKAPLPSMHFAEGGQSSTGSLLRWIKSRVFNDERVSYAELDELASKIPPGCDGLVALETFQGARTPVTDPKARGAFVGLTLSHTNVHLYRALMEAVCYGTRACVEGLTGAGHSCNEIILAGGIARSPLWLQMHSDVTKKPIVVCEYPDAPLLGCAILASVGCGVHSNLNHAVKAMVRTAKTVKPQSDVADVYEYFYATVYKPLSDAIRPIAHKLNEFQRGKMTDGMRNAHENVPTNSGDDMHITPLPEISPSILAADWADVKGELRQCLNAGANRIHVDIFDGVFLDSPWALTFGPQMVQAIRTACDENLYGPRKAWLDLHVCVDRPMRYVQAMSECGADCFIFQWEATKDIDEAFLLAKTIVVNGMKCGISINPDTPPDVIYPLLESGYVSVVDVLAVNPGFGGQTFQSRALEKIRDIKEWRQASRMSFTIMVDGGVNKDTIIMVREAGADVAVAGTSVFRHKDGPIAGVSELRSSYDHVM